jgi:poly(hydroxyalkanoate) depolymerase family esterase
MWPRLQRRLEGTTEQRVGDAAARVVDGTFSNASGTRTYRLYQPRWWHLGARPLVVMLHGCRQTPDDFAAGTTMHARGEGRGCFVLYPGQTREANRLGCWNWFEELHQRHDRGEPSILADMIRQMLEGYRIDPDRVYVAGLSAGGAMAAILATTHPELFAAVGIHSGLPYGAASNPLSALVAMSSGPARRRVRPGDECRGAHPTIVFHGDQDATVHPGNGDELIARVLSTATASQGKAATVRLVSGVVPDGHAWTRTLHQDAGGRCHAEHWVIHGSGHAWSGGDPAGSYTDPRGPDASREMLRFFREHPRQTRAAPPGR